MCVRLNLSRSYTKMSPGSFFSPLSALPLTLAALALLILLQDEGCFGKELDAHSRPPITINAMNCPCVQRDDCPRVYGESAVDIRELGFLEPCTEFGTVRCCGVAIRIEQTMGALGSYASEIGNIELGEEGVRAEGNVDGNLYLTEVERNIEDLKVEESSVNNHRASLPLQMDRSTKSMMGNRARFSPSRKEMEKVEGAEPRANPSSEVRVDLRMLESSENPSDTIIIEAIPISPGQDSPPLGVTGSDRKKELRGRILNGGPQRTTRPLVSSHNLKPSSKYASSPPPPSKLNLTSKPSPRPRPSKNIPPTEKIVKEVTTTTTQRPRRPNTLSPVSAPPKIRPFSYNKRPLPPPPSHRASSSEQLGLSPVQMKLSKSRQQFNEQSSPGSDAPPPPIPTSTHLGVEDLMEGELGQDEKLLTSPPPPPPPRNQRRRPQRLRGPEAINNAAPEIPLQETVGMGESEMSNSDTSVAPSKSPPAFPQRRRTGPRIRPFNPTPAAALKPYGILEDDRGMETAETVSFPNRAGGMHKLTRAEHHQASTVSPSPGPYLPPPAAPQQLPEALSGLQPNISIEEIRNVNEKTNRSYGESHHEDKSSGTQTPLPLPNATETPLPQNVIRDDETDLIQNLHPTPTTAPSSKSPPPPQEETSKASYPTRTVPNPGNPLPRIRHTKLRRKQQEETKTVRMEVKETKGKAKEAVKTSSQYSRIRLTTQELSDPKDSASRAPFGTRLSQTGALHIDGERTRFSIPTDLFPAREQGSYGKGESDGAKEAGRGQGERAEGNGVINFDRGSEYHLVLDKEKRKNLEISPRPNSGTPNKAGQSPPDHEQPLPLSTLPPTNRFRPQTSLSTSSGGITYQNFTKSLDDMHPGENAQESRIHPTSIQITGNDMKHGGGEPPAPQTLHAYTSNVNQAQTKQNYNQEKGESEADGNGSQERNRKKIKYRIRVPTSTTTTTPSTPTPSNHFPEREDYKSTLLSHRPGSVAYNPFDSYTDSHLSSQAPQPPPSHSSDPYSSPPTNSRNQVQPMPSPPSSPVTSTTYPPPLIRIQSVPQNQPYISSRPPPTTTQTSTFVFPPYRGATEKTTTTTTTTTTEASNSLNFGPYKSDYNPSASSTLPPTRIKISPPPSPSLFAEEEEKSKVRLANLPERVQEEIRSSGDKYGSENKSPAGQQKNTLHSQHSQSQSSPKGGEEGARGSDSKLYGGHKQSFVPINPSTNPIKLDSQDWRGMEYTPRPSQGSWSLNMPQTQHHINAPKAPALLIPVNDTRSAQRPSYHAPSSYQQYSSPPDNRQTLNQEVIKYQGGRQPPSSQTYDSSPGVRQVNRTRFSIPQRFHFPGGDTSGESYAKPLQQQQHRVTTHGSPPAPPQREDGKIRNTQVSSPARHPPSAPPRPQRPNYYQEKGKEEEKVVEGGPPRVYHHQYPPPTTIRFSSLGNQASSPPQHDFSGSGTTLKAEREQVDYSPGSLSQGTHMHSKDAHPTQNVPGSVNPSVGSLQSLEIKQELAPIAYESQLHNTHHPQRPPPLPSASPPMYQHTPLIPQHQSPYTEEQTQGMGAGVPSTSTSVHLPPDQQLAHSFQPAHSGPFSRPEQLTNDLPFLSPSVRESASNNKFHGNYLTHTPNGVIINFSSIPSRPPPPPGTRHKGFKPESTSPTHNGLTNDKDQREAAKESESQEEGSFSKQSKIHPSSSPPAFPELKLETPNPSHPEQDQHSFQPNLHHQSFQPPNSHYRQHQPQQAYQPYYNHQQAHGQFLQQRPPDATSYSPSANKDLHLSPQFPINFQAPSNAHYNSKADGSNPWIFPPPPPQPSSPSSRLEGESQSQHSGFNVESALVPGRYGPPPSLSNNVQVGSPDARPVRHGATPSYALPPASYPFQYSGTHLRRDGGATQQVGRPSLPQAIVTQLGSSIRNSRATNFSEPLPGKRLEAGGEGDEAWLEKGGSSGGENPERREFHPTHSIPLHGQGEGKDKGKLMEMTTAFPGISHPQTAHESQLSKFENDDQKGFGGTENLFSIPPNPPPQQPHNRPKDSHFTEEKVLYEFHPKFKPPQQLQRGFLPILPYSEEDPGPLHLKISSNHSPDAFTSPPPQIPTYTTP